jgi:hypothetical protein
MREIGPLQIASVSVCAIMLSAFTATGQNTTPEPDLPYGGPPVASGSFGPGTGPLTSSSVCASSDPCVLTGQYNQHRNSTNGNATKLGQMANLTDYANFGLAYVYPVTKPAAGRAYDTLDCADN